MKTFLFAVGLLIACTAMAQQPAVTVQLLRPDYTGQAQFYTECLAPAGHGVQLHYNDSRITWPDNAYLITDASGNILSDSLKLPNRHSWSGFTLKYLAETNELVQSLGSVFEDSTNIGDISLRRWNAASFQAEPTIVGGNPNLVEYPARVIKSVGGGRYLLGSDYRDTMYSPLTNTWYPITPSASINLLDTQGNAIFSANINVAKWGIGRTYAHGLIPVGKSRYFASMLADYEHYSIGTGYHGCVIVGYDASGDTLFTRHIAGYPYGLQPSNRGAILVSVVVEDLDSVRKAAYPRLVKLDSLGNTEWEQVCRGAVAGIAMPLILSQPLPDGGILLGYTSRNPDNTYGNEMFVSRYSATGQMIWEQFIAVPGADNIEQLLIHPDGTIWAAGQHIILGTSSKTYLLAKLTDPSLLGTDLAQSPLIAVWPNPVAGSHLLHVQLSSSQAQLELLDVQGRSLRSYQATSPNTDLDVSGLANGVYLLRISSPQGSTTRQVVISD